MRSLFFSVLSLDCPRTLLVQGHTRRTVLVDGEPPANIAEDNTTAEEYVEGPYAHSKCLLIRQTAD